MPAPASPSTAAVPGVGITAMLTASHPPVFRNTHD